ncbi:MAG: hypothetical protein ACE14P_07015 [Methanotrichaceae archaeon]
MGRWWLMAISVTLFGAAIFYPCPTPNIASYIHGPCGGIVIVTFPIAATLYSSGLAHSWAWIASRRQLLWATILVWIGLLSYIRSTIVLGILAGPVNRTSASLLIGWQNRFMILTYSLWLAVVA